MEKEFSFGAIESPYDKRTVQHLRDMAVPLVSGGVEYIASDIDHQHRVGICTAISRTQLRSKQTGRKYSPDFQYLLQKKYYDRDWNEGSSIFHAMKVAKNYGFLPAELWTYTTEADRNLPYTQYIEKLKSIPETEIQRLIGLCVDKIPGYAQVDVSSPQSIAKAIEDSPGTNGILCRYVVGNEWYTPSWKPKDIDPIRPPKNPEGGHAIIGSKYNFTTDSLLTHPNTWGTDWNNKGVGHINWNNYRMTEAYIDLNESPLFKFNKDLKFGMIDDDVKELQKRLGVIQTGFFGYLTLAAVKRYQTEHGIINTGYVGKLTRGSLNS
jgi:peptidoglycan hydrolase-like protein with peptidoglycan-binding domain